MSNQPQSNNDNPILSYYREWSDKTPYVTRTTMILLLVTYLVSFLADLNDYFGNVTYYSILNYEVYRLFLSPLVGNSIFNVVLMALFFPAMGARMESSIGSSAFLILMGTLAITTNVVFVLICLFLYYVGNLAEAMFYSCSGFWLVLFGLITMECLQNPDQPRRMMMVPVDIPSKYFPLIMYAMFSLFAGPKLDLALGMCMGFLYQNGLMERVKPSSYYLEGLESTSGLLHSISRGKGWVLAGAAIGHDAWIAVNSAAAGGGAGHQQTSSSSSTGSSAPAGRGGFGAWAAQENGAAGPDAGGDSSSRPSAPFGGSGRALGSTAAATSTGGGGGWLGGGGGDNSSGTGGVKDRESVAARRLAALTNQQGSSSREGTSSESGGAQADLQRLQVSGRMSDIKREAMADAASKRSRLSDKKGNLVANPSPAADATAAQTSLLAASTILPRYT